MRLLDKLKNATATEDFKVGVSGSGITWSLFLSIGFSRNLDINIYLVDVELNR